LAVDEPSSDSSAQTTLPVPSGLRVAPVAYRWRVDEEQPSAVLVVFVAHLPLGQIR